ncbi:MAG: redox-regulated ATPase YchF [bacterium]|nr:redox-regulated ATPase YchF [bacterium]
MSGIRCGIVGLPNVGKSTLFNALTSTAAAQVGNFPFSTIEPNIGRVSVPDTRLVTLAAVSHAPKTVRNHIEFVDIAGLVKGASRGEGLGNRFLASIREVDAILHLVRCFEGGDVAHVDGAVDPLRDIETIETELMLADLESLERRTEATSKRAAGGDREAAEILPLMHRALEALAAGRPARSVQFSGGEARAFAMLQLLTSRPVLYVCNVDEDAMTDDHPLVREVERHARSNGSRAVAIAASLESELAVLPGRGEREAFLEELGLGEPGLNRIIRATHEMLGLITFFTTGPKEARAWSITNGATAAQAAGTVHSDMERGFICAETITHDDLVACGSEQDARSRGLMRREGRNYRVMDGDVFCFRFNV